MHDKKQYEVLKRASLFLEKQEREAKIAELLLQHHLGLSRTAFFMNMHEHIPDAIYEAFMHDIREHAETGKPVQHMIGSEEFYGRRFLVDNNVLIPRPETEELVQHVIQTVKASKKHALHIVDAGTGSGVIAITLSLELADASVAATDISSQALAIAKKNAENLGADVEFFQGDFLLPILHQEKTVDIIVSNPPYIAENERESLADTVKNFDPELALFAEDNGLGAYKKMIKQACGLLKPDGILAFEIGHTQGETIKKRILDSFPQAVVDIIQDMNGKDRIILAKIG